MDIWEAPDEYKSLVNEIKEAHHQHLAQASIWVLVSDAKSIVDNRLVPTDTRRCTSTEKLKTNHDFKIIIRAGAWNVLTDNQRRVAIDEALCRCGVKYEPETIEINGKKEIVTDEIGRVIYTNTIAVDKYGEPKWKINHLDAGIYFALLQRHKVYSDEVENVQRALIGQPLKVPVAATQQVIGNEVDDDALPEEQVEEIQEAEAPETPADTGGGGTDGAGIPQDGSNAVG